MRPLFELAKALPSQPLNIFAPDKFIQFNELGSTGFGDRLRGIALMAFLASIYRANQICYKEESSDAFPWKLANIISFDGLEFISDQRARQLPKLLEVNHNCSKGTTIKRFGYKHMKRLRPSSIDIRKKLDSLALGANYIGIRVRTTDSAHPMEGKASGNGKPSRSILDSIHLAQQKYGYSHAYLACDSLVAREAWVSLLAKNTDLKLSWNSSAKYDSSILRQTGADDMLIDFFALSKCAYLIRSVPSEFSRFAGLVGGLKMQYNQLEGLLKNSESTRLGP